MQVLLLLSGGAIGTAFRYGVSTWIHRFVEQPFPYGILSVNVLGSLFIGFCWSLSEVFSFSHNTRLFLFTGFFGGFTTFSSFTLDTMNLMKAGDYKLAIINILASNILGIIAVFIGYFLGKQAAGIIR